MRIEPFKLILLMGPCFPRVFWKDSRLPRKYPQATTAPACAGSTQLPVVHYTIRVCSAKFLAAPGCGDPHKGEIVEHSSERSKWRYVQHFLLGPLHSNAFPPGCPNQIALDDTHGDKQPEDGCSFPRLFFLVPLLLSPFFTNLNILINMALLQGLHAVTAIWCGSMGQFSFPF